MLKKFSYKEEKKARIKAIINSSKNFSIPCYVLSIEKNKWLVQNIFIQTFIEKHRNIGSIYSSNFNDLTKEIYGSSENENNFEYLIAKVLTVYFIISISIKFSIDGIRMHETNVAQTFLSNIKKILEIFAVEYSFKFFTDKPPTYKTIETKTVIDNIDNIDNDLANPIKQLLMPMQSENATIGLISKVNSNLEIIKPNILINLNETDRSIAKLTWKTCMTTINNVDSAKGHKGKSELSIKDIAHNFALNASLFFKLVNLNKDKGEK